jgi:hypothetical protein
LHSDLPLRNMRLAVILPDLAIAGAQFFPSGR